MFARTHSSAEGFLSTSVMDDLRGEFERVSAIVRPMQLGRTGQKWTGVQHDVSVELQ